MVGRASGTEGYAEEAESLFRHYGPTTFAGVHVQFLDLMPTEPCRVVDIGSGTGRDAAALAAMGHTVLAIEPTAEMRTRAQALHPSPRIEWLDDSLPDLERLAGRECFGLVMLTAVWMHLDQDQRRRAMPNVARLVRPGGVMILSLRHGPVPPGRRMFEVTGDETAELAAAEGLDLVRRLENQDGFFKRPDVSWTRMAFSRPADGG